ncbi:MAG: Ig-like domain-containing protein [Gemmatimonadales bacterium]
MASILSDSNSIKAQLEPDSGLPVSPSSVRWVGLSPRLDTARAIGDTIQLSVTAKDARGNALLGASNLWSSADTTVAVVDSAGTVIARGGGTAAITVTVGGKVARARVIVDQVPVALRVSDSTFRVPEGERGQMAAKVVDARGYEIPGLPVRWHSAHPSIAAVDSLGNVSGTAPGRTTFTAAHEGLVASVAAEVYPVPASLTLLTGDRQRALAGRRLTQPVTVQVVSRSGRPIEGVPVRFVIEDGGTGRADPQIAPSDTQGIARISWTLGSAAGRQSLSILAEGVATPTTITAEAEPVAGNTRLAVVSEQLEGPAGGILPDPVVVRVTDSSGIALVDVPVAWSAEDGGSVVAAKTRTDSLGETRARWTLGPRSGVQRAYVQVGSARAVPRFQVSASALPGRPAAASVVDLAKRTGSVGKVVQPAVEIRVWDKAKNPVPGVPVTLMPSGGEVADSILTTDSTGRVVVAWTLGRKAGLHRLTAKIEGIERGVEVTARARPAAPANLAFVVSKPGTAKRTIQSVDVDLTDAYGNPVADQPVVFSTKSGSVSPAKVMTDVRGRAHTRWTPASKVGKRTLLALVKGTEARATFVLEPPTPTPAPARKEIPARKDVPATKQTVKRASR